MTTVQENALRILRVMQNVRSTNSETPIFRMELQQLTCLDKAAFDQADRYLLDNKFVDGPINKDGVRSLTLVGIQYLNTEMDKRLPFTLDAERILRYLTTPKAVKKMLIDEEELMSALDIDLERYEAACQMLEDFSLIEAPLSTGTKYGVIKATQEGRQVVHSNFKVGQAPSTQIQTGAIFQGPVSGGNIQAFHSVAYSQVEQNITQTDLTALRQDIAEMLNNLLNEVNDALDLEQKSAYMQAVSELEQEIEKPEPDPGLVHKLLTVLSFGDALGGTLELGEKSLELAVKAGPYVLPLYQFVYQFLKSLPS